MENLQSFLKSLLKIFGFSIIKDYHYSIIKKIPYCLRYYSLVTQNEKLLLSKVIPYSESQLGQDLFAYIETLDSKSNYFVEIGATNGKDLSNTFLLEKEFGWEGILLEPAKIWADDLINNRDCQIDFRAIYPTSNKTLDFIEVKKTKNSTAALSHIKELGYKKNLRNSIQYEVETVSINDLLYHYKAPDVIDYLSIDIEGNEFNILKTLDLEKRRINVITVEHSFRKRDRKNIYNLLSKKGYVRKYSEISLFDDWYVLKDEN